MKKARISLKAGLLATMIVCWLVPIAALVTLMSVLLENNYRQSVQQELNAQIENAVERVQLRLQTAIEDSKEVSYDGVVSGAYRQYLKDGIGITLYRSVNDYLNQRLARDKKYQAVIICFWSESISHPYYVLGEGVSSRTVPQIFQEHAGEILRGMEEADTEIRFFQPDGELYMARNLLDSNFDAYATVIMMFDTEYLFEPLETMSAGGGVEVTIDTCAFRLGPKGALTAIGEPEESFRRLEYTAPVDGHDLAVTARTIEYSLWELHPWFGWMVMAVAALMLPFLIATIMLFSHHVGTPMRTLAEANVRVQTGERGYQITRQPPNVDFARLFSNFNEMSGELKRQFDHSVLEQQAAQQARIKALQYQISPHFLNNALEIINWEARLAGNEQVSTMIEALSTMLDAALDRDNQDHILLQDELIYVDAYLYIIEQRLGEGFRVYKEIDGTLLEEKIPRMILQPIAENAIEHDIAARHGGSLWVRAYRGEKQIVLEIEHDGVMTEQDRKNIDALLEDTTTTGSHVGLRNVCQRLRLIYGQQAGLYIEGTQNGTILARLCLPDLPKSEETGVTP